MASCLRSSRRLPRQFFSARSYSATTSPSTPPAVLVGSPDLVSNLRPVIYDGVWFKAISTPPDPSSPSSLPKATLVRPDDNTEHPYALSEFPLTQGHETDKFFTEKQNWNLEYRLMKQSLDAFNHAFWTDTNTRFNAYKHFVEESTKASEEYKAADQSRQELLLEDATASFYQVWQATEEKRQRAYTKELYRRTFSLIWRLMPLSASSGCDSETPS